jgi:outer membrane protein insertion porin family
MTAMNIVRAEYSMMSVCFLRVAQIFRFLQIRLWGAMLLTALIVAAFAPMNEASAYVVSAIEVEGNQRVDRSTVLSYMTVQPGVPFTASDLNNDIKSLAATGLFARVSASRPSGGVLRITVVENKIVNRVAFEGNKKLDDEALANVVQLKPRGVLTDATIQSDTQRILEAYRRSGRFTASVEPKLIDLPQNRVDVVFEITEGKKSGVSRINFIGNQAFSDGKLRDIVKTAQSGFLSFLRTTDIYDPDRLNADQEQLRQFYLDNGYADFRVVSAVADYDRERNIFFITFTLDEGQQYRYGNIEIDSTLRELNVEDLRSELLTRSGDVYDASDVDESIENLTLRVSEYGYAFAQVRPRGSRNREAGTIDITYFIDQGARVYVERINIIGNTRTRDYVIRREFDLAEGDAFNRVLVNRAKRRLEELRFFERVNITTEPGSAPDRVILNVNVEEKPTGEVSFGVGYSTSDGVIGDLSISERNFLGRGQFVRAAIGGGESRRSYEFSFTEPYFMGRRLSAGFDLYRKEQQNNDFVSYDTETTGGAVRFGLPISEHTSLQLKYSLFQQDISLPVGFKDGCTSATPVVAGGACDPNADGIEELNRNEASLAIIQAEGETLTSMVSYTLTYNSLDSSIKPRDGILATFTQEVAGLGGDVDFLRTTADARYYRTLSTDLDLIGMVRGQAGAINTWNSNDVRVLDAFYKGPNLVRGFEPSGIGPRDITVGSTRDALGGKYYFGGTVELNFPIYGLPPQFGLRGAVFADAGTVFEPSDRAVTAVGAANVADDSSFRSSVGASVIWDSPFGPLRGDFAYAVSKESYDETQVFRFSGGTRF